MTHIISDNERSVLHAVMRQAESDLKSAHAEICKLQNIDPAKHTWPAWSPQANSLQWFEAIREKFPALPDPGRPVPHHGSGPDNCIRDFCGDCGEPIKSVPNSGDQGRCDKCRAQHG